MILFDDLIGKLENVKKHPFYKNYLELYKARFEIFQTREIPLLTHEDFILFETKGSRVEYETKYFERRDRLVCAFILYLVYEEEKYMQDLIKTIKAILTEISWVVPAHLAGYDENLHYGHIDLFAAETAADLAEILYLIGDKLPFETKENIMKELDGRTFNSFEERSFWWEDLKSNWAAVCAGCVGMAYMLTKPDKFYEVKERILKVIDNFLSGYGEDGCCIEGIAYWEYGFGFFINFADMLYKFTNGKDDLLHSEKVAKIARYLDYAILREDVALSFSDGSRTYSGINIGLYSYLYKNYSDVVLPKIKTMIYREKTSHCRLSFAVRNFLWSNPEDYTEEKPMRVTTKYCADAKWYVAKRDKYSFAAKAGHNKEEHNHNDVGSFIVATDKGQLLCDLGAMAYTRENFDLKTRYTFLNNSSLGHSVPIIDGKGQHYGEEYFGEVIKTDENCFEITLHNAYETNIKSITRKFRIFDDKIQLTDSFEDADKHTVTERFVSVIKPEIVSGGIRIGECVLKTGLTPEISTDILTLHNAVDKLNVYLIDFVGVNKEFTVEIEIDE